MNSQKAVRFILNPGRIIPRPSESVALGRPLAVQALCYSRSHSPGQWPAAKAEWEKTTTPTLMKIID